MSTGFKFFGNKISYIFFNVYIYKNIKKSEEGAVLYKYKYILNLTILISSLE